MSNNQKVEVYSETACKNVRLQLALFDMPKRHENLKEGNIPIILDWIESRRAFATCYYCFVMISRYCKNILARLTLNEMKKSVNNICTQNDNWERLVPVLGGPKGNKRRVQILANSL